MYPSPSSPSSITPVTSITAPNPTSSIPNPYAILISKCSKYIVDTKNGVNRFGIFMEGTAPFTSPQISTNTLSISIYNQKTGKQPLSIQTVPIQPDGTWTLSTGVVPDATYLLQASVGINSHIPTQNAETILKIYRDHGYIGYIYVFLPLILLLATFFITGTKKRVVLTYIDIVYFISFIVIVSMYHKNSFTTGRLGLSIVFSVLLFLVFLFYKKFA